MKIGFYNIYHQFNNNRIFNKMELPIGDDLTYPFRYLANYARMKGIHLSTIDTQPLDDYDAIVFMDFPGRYNKYLKELQDTDFDNLFLMLFENEVIRKENWDTDNYRMFKKVFTWSTSIKTKNTSHYYLPVNVPMDPHFSQEEKTTLCTLLASRKSSSHPHNLYEERVRAIRWFEQNHPEDFDLYGIGWYKIGPFGNPSYKGRVSSKNATLRKYKFSICYENARDIPGYVTEKIFDSFFAGCVPVYWGASDITDTVPEDTFIDMRKYPTYSHLYEYISTIPDNVYQEYLDNILDYIHSDEIQQYNTPHFTETILNGILEVF